jgi:hypothetical protein
MVQTRPASEETRIQGWTLGLAVFFGVCVDATQTGGYH